MYEQIVQIRACGDHSFALSKKGTLFSFGKSDKGVLGLGNVQVSRSPTKLIFPDKVLVKHFACSHSQAMAVTEHRDTDNRLVRTLWVWGTVLSSASQLQLLSLPQIVPVPLEEGERVERVFCGGKDEGVSFFEVTNRKSQLPMREIPIPHLSARTMDGLFKTLQDPRPSTLALLSLVFSCPPLLNASFLDSERHLSFSRTLSGIDLQLVRSFFSRLVGHTALFSHVATAMYTCISRLHTSASLVFSHEALRVLQVCLESPFFMRTDSNNIQALEHLLTFLFAIPPPLKNLLLDFFGKYTVPFFSTPLYALRSLTTYLLSRHINPKLLQNAILFLQNLYQVNYYNRIVPYTSFYNPDLVHLVDLNREYWNWRSGGFSLCQYPFILPATLKCKLIQMDAEDSMKKNLESAVYTSFISGQELKLFLGAKLVSFSFFQKLKKLFFQAIVVRRKYVVEDALVQLQQKDIHELKKPLKVVFHGEEGIDAGGVKKDFFTALIKRLFDPNFGMFTYDPEQRTFWINPNARDQTQEFLLIGMILGLAIYNSVILDVQFPMVFYKKLIGEKGTLEDLASSHPDIAKNLRKLLDYQGEDLEDVFCLTFQVANEFFGAIQLVDLTPGGGEVAVTQKNKQQYVELYTNYLLDLSIRAQFDHLSRGFKMIAGPVLSLFRPEELELLICGSKQFDLDQLEKSTTYKNCNPQTSQIVWFWKVLKSLTLQQQKKFLLFATACDRVPINGFAELNFVIQINTNDNSRLPTAATCFNTLNLPAYRSEALLREKLIFSIENAEGFGLK